MLPEPAAPSSKNFNPTGLPLILCKGTGWSGVKMIAALRDAIDWQAKQEPEVAIEQIGVALVNGYRSYQAEKGTFAVLPQKYFEQGLYQGAAQNSTRKKARYASYIQHVEEIEEDRKMPQSLEHAIETEWHLLNADRGTLGDDTQVAQDLDPQDFSLSATRSIFSAIVCLAENEGVVDVLQVQKWCDDNRTGVTVDAVIRLTDLGGVLSSIPFYAKLVRKNSLRRRLKSLCDLMSSRLDDQTIETAECMTELVEGAFELQADHKAGVRHMSVIMHDTMNELAAEREQKGGLAGYSTGLDSLDMVTGGLRDSEVWVVGAIPGRGKTALGLQACLANVARQTPVLIMSLEMSATQDARRILAQCGDVKSYLIRDPRQMTEVQWCNLIERSAEIGKWPVYIDDCAYLTVRQLISRIRLYVRRYKVKFIVIDYLQLVQGTGRELRERVSQVSNALRIVASRKASPSWCCLN
jgi:replicative DNA helicase